MLYFAGTNFWKAFKIVGLEARKSGRGVEQDLYGHFRPTLIFFFCLFLRPPLNHSHSCMV